ncbi:uncharacterized protein LOC128882823 [Hylaeus volcanicus]|uniref:uncharacterized protein LOC128882823 n=1 Tax=Hylaeus volcanicus TaxID=313075 RepID=UPI0023B7C59B|nr:uncharacterized protein LOC128882823 [Hylaeus volcanicus]
MVGRETFLVAEMPLRKDAPPPAPFLDHESKSSRRVGEKKKEYGAGRTPGLAEVSGSTSPHRKERRSFFRSSNNYFDTTQLGDTVEGLPISTFGDIGYVGQQKKRWISLEEPAAKLKPDRRGASPRISFSLAERGERAKVILLLSR